MSTTSTGRQAEVAAANYLLRHGFKVLDRNWRTRWCEIDIIAEKAGRLYFVEVKYRKSTDWGTGFDHITFKKMQQMQFAADMWVAAHQWFGCYALSALEVTGDQFVVSDFLEDVLR